MSEDTLGDNELMRTVGDALNDDDELVPTIEDEEMVSQCSNPDR